MIGVLFPLWLIYEFDCGLYRERTNFGFVYQDRWERLYVCFYKYITLLSVGLMVISVISIAGNRMGTPLATGNILISFFLVLSGLFFLSFLHQVYLWREIKYCKKVNEHFERKRQENEMFFFLFFYTVTYLSGGKFCLLLFFVFAILEKYLHLKI